MPIISYVSNNTRTQASNEHDTNHLYNTINEQQEEIMGNQIFGRY